MKLDELTDEQLIRKSYSGNEQAFKILILRYETLIASTVMGMLGPGPEAEDVGQEVFIRFYQSLGRFKGQSSLGTYLTRIAINLSLNELKRRKKRRLRIWYKSIEDEPNIPDETSSGEYNDEEKIVHQAIQKLRPEFRLVIVLRLLDGYSTRETAEILGIPEGTVLSRLARAQKKLKSFLTPYFGEEYGEENTPAAASVL